jgi:hypothetical protein
MPSCVGRTPGGTLVDQLPAEGLLSFAKQPGHAERYRWGRAAPGSRRSRHSLAEVPNTSGYLCVYAIVQEHAERRDCARLSTIGPPLRMHSFAALRAVRPTGVAGTGVSPVRPIHRRGAIGPCPCEPIARRRRLRELIALGDATEPASPSSLTRIAYRPEPGFRLPWPCQAPIGLWVLTPPS